MAQPVHEFLTSFDPPCVLVCEGKDCKEDGARKLSRRLEEEGLMVEAVKCLGVCSGPVIVAPAGGKVRVLQKVRGRKRRDRVAESIAAGGAGDLTSLQPKKPKRKKAIERAEKRIAKLVPSRS